MIDTEHRFLSARDPQKVVGEKVSLAVTTLKRYWPVAPFVLLMSGAAVSSADVSREMLSIQPRVAYADSLPSAGASPYFQTSTGYKFDLGFKVLADQIPEVSGTPLEAEHYGANGDSLQRTSKGLMVWRKMDNWTAFTDGQTTWINGPAGLASRPNNERFDWEKVYYRHGDDKVEITGVYLDRCYSKVIRFMDYFRENVPDYYSQMFKENVRVIDCYHSDDDLSRLLPGAGSYRVGVRRTTWDNDSYRNGPIEFSAMMAHEIHHAKQSNSFSEVWEERRRLGQDLSVETYNSLRSQYVNEWDAYKVSAEVAERLGGDPATIRTYRNASNPTLWGK